MSVQEGNIVTSANDVDMIIDPVTDGLDKSGTGDSDVVRLVVDEFSMTREDGSELVSSVGSSQPSGISSGDVTYNISFSLMGSNVELWKTLHDGAGDGRYFAFTARKPGEWEKSLAFCRATNEEDTASTGDPYEFSVEAIGMGYDSTDI